jgi:hypothetical protein
MTSSATPGMPPPEHVLAAFGARETPTPLQGGRGHAWRAGTIVLKPVDTSEESLAWEAQVLGEIRTEGFPRLTARTLHRRCARGRWLERVDLLRRPP